MNKKLFTLLTSAALMAGMAPSVFAETMNFKITPSEEKVDGKKVYDVTLEAPNGVTGMQFYFKSNGDLGTNDSYNKKDIATNGFHPDKDGVDEMFDGEGSLTYTPELYKKPGFETKATEAENYQVAGAATGSSIGDTSKGIKIGTLTVGEATDGATWVDVNVKKSKATYTNPTDKSVARYEWNVVTDDSSSDDSSDAPSSTSEVSSSDVSSQTSSLVSSSETSSQTSSLVSSSETSSQTSSNVSSDNSNNSNTSSNNGGGNNSQGGGNNDNVNTGVASTAVVALAAASAALVVVSKKRK